MQTPSNTPPNNSELQDLPELRRNAPEPKGVLQKNLKILLYLGAALLVILAAVFSSGGKKTPNGQPSASKEHPPQPIIQDNTDNNVQDLKNQLAAERLKEQQQAAYASSAGIDPTLAGATPAQQAAAAVYAPNGQPVPCAPGQPCPQSPYGQQSSAQAQLSPAQQQAQLIAAKEREMAYNSRFASNLAYVHSAETAAQSRGQEGGVSAGYQLPSDQSFAPGAR